MSTYISDFLKDFVFRETSGLNSFPGEKRTLVEEMQIGGLCFPKYINEFWTSKQRQGSAIHQISYRACFKSQLPRFFINLLTEEEEVVYDPFCGRGTTIIEAALLGRRVISNDVNPLSVVFSKPRLAVPSLKEIEIRLGDIPLDQKLRANLDLSMFFYPDTEGEIISLQHYLKERKKDGKEDNADSWIRMVATNRLTGHSPGFFSVYTLPPNQAVSPERQKKINLKRNQQPVYRDTKKIILKKSHSLLKNLNSSEKEALHKAWETALFLQKDARDTSELPENSVQLTVTSPPFLDVVQYSKDNWLRCWFNDIKTEEIEEKITMARTVEEWSLVMGGVFEELFRITKKGGWVAFEVGEVKQGKIRLDEHVINLGLRAGFVCEGVIINQQVFTKTSNIWGISNNDRGTNTNRIVVFNKR